MLLTRIKDAPAPPHLDVVVARGAVDMLVDAHCLSQLEVDVLLLAVGAAVDADFARLLVAAGGARRQSPTVSGALSVLLDDPTERLRARAHLGGEGRLVRYGLLRRRSLGDSEQELVATRRAIAGALGQHPLADLPPWARRTVAATEPETWTELEPRQVAAALRTNEPPGALCLVRGASGSGRSTWARIAVHALHPCALVIDVPGALAAADEGPFEIADLCEDAALADVPVLLDDADEALGRGEPLVAALLSVVERVPLCALVVAHADTVIDPRVHRRIVYQARIGPPPPRIREVMWGSESLSGVSRVIADELVLSPAQIRNARRLVAAGVGPLAAALSQVEGEGLLADVRERVALDDLVVGDEVRAELVELITAVRVRGAVQEGAGRGRGLSALFDGEPGTGKTLACEVVAREVQLPLMRVNVATLVDKYVGETEKNLARTFAQARARGGILLFDEADALFASRTEVGRAQDRYANLETNLLLQLLEEHPGIVLLTTNLRGNLDQAFLRRLTFKISFARPDAAGREILWRRHLPPDHGVRDEELVRLAQVFELAGGGIKNAVVRARYRAFGAERGLRLDDVVACAERELAATGRVAAWTPLQGERR